MANNENAGKLLICYACPNNRKKQQSVGNVYCVKFDRIITNKTDIPHMCEREYTANETWPIV